MRRRLYITALLSASGAGVGAVLAPVLSFLATVVANATLPVGHVEYFYSAAEFAVVGALGTPALAWLLLRRVPLWRAIAEPALGCVLGTLIALAAIPLVHPALILQPLCILAGIIAAAVRLRRAHGAMLGAAAQNGLFIGSDAAT